MRARRAELRAARIELTGGHRGELRGALALARLEVAAEFTGEFAQLDGQARAFLDGSGGSHRSRFPALLPPAVDDLRRWASARREASVRAAVRRIAGSRGLSVEPGWPPAGEPTRPMRLLQPEAATAGLWTGVAGGWRTALLPAAALPVLGLPVAGPGAVLATLGLGLIVAAVVGSHYAAIADRARLRRWCDGVLAAARADSDAALARLLIRVEQAAGGELDAAVTRRRAEIDAELLSLAPEGGASGHLGENCMPADRPQAADG